MLREAIDLLQHVLDGGTLLEGDFRWMCASPMSLGGFRSMRRTERAVFACRPNMRTHMHQLQQHCLELWTRRLLTPKAGRKDHFLAQGTPTSSGGGNGLVKAPAGVVGAPGATTGSANQVPLCGAGTGGGGPPSAAGLPLAQPTDSARPGAEHSALGGDNSPPPLGPTGAPVGGGGGARCGRRASVARG